MSVVVTQTLPHFVNIRNDPHFTPLNYNNSYFIVIIIIVNNTGSFVVVLILFVNPSLAPEILFLQ